MSRWLRQTLVTAGVGALVAAAIGAGSGLAAAQSASPSASSSASTTASPTGTPAAATLQVQAGGGETGITVEDFFPMSLTVKTGTIVTWKNPFGEPHTITFGSPTGDPTVPQNVPASGPAQYNGSGFLSSGLFAPDFQNGPPGTPSTPDTFSIQFTKAGSYDYYCAIHVNMGAHINVVDSGTADTQAGVDGEIQSEYATALAGLKALEGQQPTAATMAKNADGTSTYTVETGAYNPDGDLVQFFPAAVNIASGDTVKWVSNSVTPHTITFNPDSFQGDPLHDGPSGGTTFDGTGLVNSGIINQPSNFYPPSVFTSQGASYQLTFTKAGSYQYICLLHAGEGMVGTVNVSQATTPPPSATPTKTSTGGAPQPPNTGTGTASSSGNSLWVGLGLLAALFVLSGAGVVAVKRHN